jgi:hypothetical protein
MTAKAELEGRQTATLLYPFLDRRIFFEDIKKKRKKKVVFEPISDL